VKQKYYIMENTKIHISGSSLGIGFFPKKTNKKSDILKYFVCDMEICDHFTKASCWNEKNRGHYSGIQHFLLVTEY